MTSSSITLAALKKALSAVKLDGVWYSRKSFDDAGASLGICESYTRKLAKTNNILSHAKFKKKIGKTRAFSFEETKKALSAVELDGIWYSTVPFLDGGLNLGITKEGIRRIARFYKIKSYKEYKEKLKKIPTIEEIKDLCQPIKTELGLRATVSDNKCYKSLGFKDRREFTKWRKHYRILQVSRDQSHKSLLIYTEEKVRKAFGVKDGTYDATIRNCYAALELKVSDSYASNLREKYNIRPRKRQG